MAEASYRDGSPAGRVSPRRPPLPRASPATNPDTSPRRNARGPCGASFLTRCNAAGKDQARPRGPPGGFPPAGEADDTVRFPPPPPQETEGRPLTQYRHYKACLNLFQLNPSKESREFADLVKFLAQAGCPIPPLSWVCSSLHFKVERKAPFPFNVHRYHHHRCHLSLHMLKEQRSTQQNPFGREVVIPSIYCHLSLPDHPLFRLFSCFQLGSSLRVPPSVVPRPLGVKLLSGGNRNLPRGDFKASGGALRCFGAVTVPIPCAVTDPSPKQGPGHIHRAASPLLPPLQMQQQAAPPATAPPHHLRSGTSSHFSLPSRLSLSEELETPDVAASPCRRQTSKPPTKSTGMTSSIGRCKTSSMGCSR